MLEKGRCIELVLLFQWMQLARKFGFTQEEGYHAVAETITITESMRSFARPQKFSFH